jgi:hypothetical protein
LGVVAVFAVLLDTGVQIADAAPSLGHSLAVQLEDEAEDAVGRRVLWPHIDHDVLLASLPKIADDLVPVAPAQGVNPAFGRLVRPGRHP